MATLEDELKDLKEKNNELAQKVQYWKMTAAQKDDEKLALIKENNDLRLKLSRLRNSGGKQAQQLDSALQEASEKAISHLVKASAEIAKSMELAKAYMRERQELEAHPPRWSAIGGTPTAEKSDRVHRVPPMMIGGQPIQPVVALSRTMFNTSNPRPESRSSSHNVSERAVPVPMHMLQDVYIPLTRIDDVAYNNVDNNAESNVPEGNAQETSMEDDPDEFQDSDGHISHISEEDDEVEEEQSPTVGSEYKMSLVLTPYLEIEKRRFTLGSPSPSLTSAAEVTRQAEAVAEAARQREAEAMRQAEEARKAEAQALRLAEALRGQGDPLEGPSWLLDITPTNTRRNKSKSRVNLEPDSTTEPETTSQDGVSKTESERAEFSPTVRRRKRTSSPPALATPKQYSPRPNDKRNSSGRVLKVMVAKMRLSETSSPPKRARSPRDLNNFDAPSPNGATDSRVIVSAITSIRSESINPSQDDISTQDSGLHSMDDSNVTRRTDAGRRGTSQERDSSQSRRGRGRVCSAESRDSDSGSGGAGDTHSEGRSRRPKKPVTYKEKPLNSKLRR